MKSVHSPAEEQLRRLQPMVRQMAFQMSTRLPACVELDDLVQAGMIGLHDAAGRFQEGAGGLEQFAQARIRGAMIDELRTADWAPRRCRRSQRRVDAASSRLTHRLLRKPSDTELASELGMPIAELQAQRLESEISRIVYLEDAFDSTGMDAAGDGGLPSTADPIESLELRDLHQVVQLGLARLSARKQRVVRLYYFAEKSLREIGTELGTTESRVCQLHREALAELRRMFQHEESMNQDTPAM